MKRLFLVSVAALAASACVNDDEDPYAGEGVKDDGKEDSSALGVFVDAEFDGKLITDSSWNDEQTIHGPADLHGRPAQRLHRASAASTRPRSRTSRRRRSTARRRSRTRAKLPVIWGKRNGVPTTIELKLPLDISYAGQEAFATKYKHDCVDFGAHDVDAGSMFYYFRPRRSGCNIAAADVHAVDARRSRRARSQTTGKFPEYNKVWEDNTLNVVAIFGKYEDGATTGSRRRHRRATTSSSAR